MDVSRIAVFENGIWLGDGCARELRLADGNYESVSLWELELAKDLIRQRDPQHRLRPHSWLVHILEARELIEQRQTEQKLIRRKLQQLRERRPGRPRYGSTVQPLEADQITQTEQLMAEMKSKDTDPRTRLLDTLGRCSDERTTFFKHFSSCLADIESRYECECCPAAGRFTCLGRSLAA